MTDVSAEIIPLPLTLVSQRATACPAWCAEKNAHWNDSGHIMFTERIEGWLHANGQAPEQTDTFTAVGLLVPGSVPMVGLAFGDEWRTTVDGARTLVRNLMTIIATLEGAS